MSTRPGSKIIRLCSLIGDNIKKNVLYDLKHNQYISQINFNDVCQWYPLNNLVDDISKTTQKETNFVSEPIPNSIIIENFCPEMVNHVRHEKHNHYEIKPYMYTSEYILSEMKKYYDKDFSFPMTKIKCKYFTRSSAL